MNNTRTISYPLLLVQDIHLLPDKSCNFNFTQSPSCFSAAVCLLSTNFFFTVVYWFFSSDRSIGQSCTISGCQCWTSWKRGKHLINTIIYTKYVNSLITIAGTSPRAYVRHAGSCLQLNWLDRNDGFTVTLCTIYSRHFTDITILSPSLSSFTSISRWICLVVYILFFCLFDLLL